MILSVLLLVLIAGVALWLVLEPLRPSSQAGTQIDPDAPERERLSAERDRLYAELSALDDDPRRPDLERRAALTLRALDGLSPAPGRAGGRRLALAGVALAVLVTGVGAVTFVPRWQLASLDAAEAADVQAALSLPSLKARAEASGDNADYLAWGGAAFDAELYDQAVTAYGSALRLDPRQPVALRRLGILILTRGEQTGQPVSDEDATQAARLIRTAAGLAPDEPESQLLLGFTLARFGQDTEALGALERYRTLEPSGRDADELITSLRARLNRNDPALKVYAASCASCHGVAGGGGIAPSLRVSNLSRAALAGIIRNGKGAMPAYPKLTGAELSALLTLLEGWQRAGQ